MAVPSKKWRGERELRGIQANVQGAINGCRDGAYVDLDYKTAKAVVEIIEQARHTEIQHTHPDER